MEIRAAVAKDAPAVQRVARRTWHEVYDSILGEDVVEDTVDEWYEEQRLRESIAAGDSPMFVAVDDEVVGFAQGVPSESGPADARLNRIYVLPDHWSEGIGSELLDRLFDTLREQGHDSIWLSVMADNDVGRSFYDEHGFDVDGKHVASIGGQEVEEIVLVRDL